jgi:hypothetical protein
MSAAASVRRASAGRPSMDLSVDCKEGGKVSMVLDVSDSFEGDGSGSFSYALDYDDCSQDGINAFDGKLLTHFVSEAVAGESLSMAQKYKGKLDISGDIDDFVEADVTQLMDIDADAGTTTVVVRLSGTIKTSTATYTYDGSPLTVTVGALPAAEPQS